MSTITCPSCGQPLEIPNIQPKPAWPGQPVLVTNEEKAVLCGRGGGPWMLACLQNPQAGAAGPEIIGGTA